MNLLKDFIGLERFGEGFARKGRHFNICTTEAEVTLVNLEKGHRTGSNSWTFNVRIYKCQRVGLNDL